MTEIHEDLIKIRSYEVLGELPDPFIFSDGTKVRSKEDWRKRRGELIRLAEKYVYGEMPPAPDALETELLGTDSQTISYRIRIKAGSYPFYFNMLLFKPLNIDPPWPVVIDGDRCWDEVYNHDLIHAFLERGIAFALFDRLELVSDLRDPEKKSPLYRAYEDMSFGALTGWAWGYSRCVDALLQTGLVMENAIGFTGQSRGGKTAVLAGALDERAAFVNPNESGCGGCGCFRVRASGLTEDGAPKREESLEAILDQFDYWFSPGLRNYYGHAEALPFDSHFLKALVAPRVLLEGNAASDLWANPVGSWQTAEAAREVYRFLGVPEKHYWYYRKGYHWHKAEDVIRLAKIIRCSLDGTVNDDEYYRTPFRRPDKIYTWSAPV